MPCTAPLPARERTLHQLGDNVKSIESADLEHGAWRSDIKYWLENACDSHVRWKDGLYDDPTPSKDVTSDNGLPKLGCLTDPPSCSSADGEERRSDICDNMLESIADLRLASSLNDRYESFFREGRTRYPSTLHHEEPSTQSWCQPRLENVPVRTSGPSRSQIQKMSKDGNSGTESVGKRGEYDETIQRTPPPNMCKSRRSVTSSIDGEYSLQPTPPAAQQVSSCYKGKMSPTAVAQMSCPEIKTYGSLLSTSEIIPWDHNTYRYYQPLTRCGLEIVQYDDNWPGQFQAVKKIIMKALVTTRDMFSEPFAGQGDVGDKQSLSPSQSSHALTRAIRSDELDSLSSWTFSETSDNGWQNVIVKSTSPSIESFSSSFQSSKLTLNPLDVSLVQSIHHVGSTAIPGMSGRPIIDVAVCLCKIIRDTHKLWLSLMLKIPGIRLVSSQVGYYGHHIFTLSSDEAAGVEANIHVFFSMPPINEMLAAKWYLTVSRTAEARDLRQKFADAKQKNAQKSCISQSSNQKHGDQMHRAYETLMAEAHDEIADLAVRAWWDTYETDPATQIARKSMLERFADPSSMRGKQEYGSGQFYYDYRIKRGTEEYLITRRGSRHPARRFDYIT